MSKIGAKVRTETGAGGWAIPKFTTDSLQYRGTLDMAMTNATGDDEKRQQPVVDRCDTRPRLQPTAAYSRLERLKTCMVAGRARQRPYGAPTQQAGTEVIGPTGQFGPRRGLTKAETRVSNAPYGRLCHTNILQCRQLRFGCPRNHPLGPKPAQKGHIRDAASGIARPRQNARYGPQFAPSAPIDF